MASSGVLSNSSTTHSNSSIIYANGYTTLEISYDKIIYSSNLVHTVIENTLYNTITKIGSSLYTSN